MGRPYGVRALPPFSTVEHESTEQATRPLPRAVITVQL